MFWLLLFSCQSRHPADLIVIGQIDATGARRSIVVEGAHITAIVPANTDKRYRGPQTLVIDVPIVTAGFIDAHAHPMWMGQTLSQIDLSAAHSYQGALQLIKDAPGAGLLEGYGWDQTRWDDVPQGGWPLAADLETLHPGRLISLRRVDGHALWLSEALLKQAGVKAKAPDPTGGHIVRASSGEATGVLIDAAAKLITLPTPPRSERIRLAQLAMESIKETGLTGVHAMGVDDESVSIWAQLNTPLRLWLYVNPDTKAAERLKQSGPWSPSERVKVMGVKVYADGALGSRGALLSSPYSDHPDALGHAITSESKLVELSAALLHSGAQLAVHAIGDQAVHHTLNAFEAAGAEHSPTRLRVEHAQVVRPSDQRRFAPLHTIASMQPIHALSDHRWAEERLGPERIAWAYAWRRLSDAGAPLAFGSDFPIETANPSDGLLAATQRITREGLPVGGWYPAERISLSQAIAGYTSGAAFATHDEDRLGRVEVGHLADLSLWSEADGQWSSVGAIVNGEVLWLRASLDSP